LILHGPGLEPTLSAAQVNTLDFVPTILEYLELPDDPGVAGHGRSLLPLISKKGPIPDRPLFASGRSISQRHRDRGYELNSKFRTLSVRIDGWKLIRYPGMQGKSSELYDLEADPGEIENLASQKPETRDRYLELIERERSTAIERIEDPTLSPDQKRKLKALGYIEP
jgi:arylsulfatase A-like enzyme